jgi:hypothetical protein
MYVPAEHVAVLLNKGCVPWTWSCSAPTRRFSGKITRHSFLSKSKLLYDWRSVSHWHSCGAHDQILLFLLFFRKIALFFVLERPLWREDGSVICSAICQWSESRNTHSLILLSLLGLLGSLSVASYDSQGLRWKYSYPPPHGEFISQSQSESHFTADIQSVSQSICLGVEPTLWTFDQILRPFQVFGYGICCPVSDVLKPNIQILSLPRKKHQPNRLMLYIGLWRWYINMNLWTDCQPRRLTNSWTSTACYMDSCTFFTFDMLMKGLPGKVLSISKLHFLFLFKFRYPNIWKPPQNIFLPISWQIFLPDSLDAMKIRKTKSFLSSVPATHGFLDNFQFLLNKRYIYNSNIFVVPITVARGIRHELSSPVRTLRSWVRRPLEAWMFVYVCSVFVLSCV